MNLENLNFYLPLNSTFFVEKWLKDHSIVLKITKRRETKLGDYRKIMGNSRHQITINGDLNSYAFFFVFTHEVAHLKTFVQYNSKRINSHGKEWKTIFGQLLIESITVYPTTLQPYILHHAKYPKASLGADANILKYIINDVKSDQTYLEEIDFDTIFSIGKRIFKKGPKQKTRFLCVEIKSNKKYLISATAIINKNINNY